MKFSKYIILSGIALTMGFTSCVDDLDVKPEDPDSKTELTTAQEYYDLLARAYGGLVLEGGISVDDGGAGVYTRQLWNLQELPTDEALIGKNWNDAGIDELDFNTWSGDNHWLYECFCRFNYQIALCNEFLRTIDKAGSLIPDEGIDGKNMLKVEARVLRDLSYYHMIDIFGRGPWTDENSVVGAIPPLTTASSFSTLWLLTSLTLCLSSHPLLSSVMVVSLVKPVTCFSQRCTSMPRFTPVQECGRNVPTLVTKSSRPSTHSLPSTSICSAVPMTSMSATAKSFGQFLRIRTHFSATVVPLIFQAVLTMPKLT